MALLTRHARLQRLVVMVAILATVTEVVVAYCPPCQSSFRRHSYSLAEEGEQKGRPWGAMPPPAPNAPMTPCGCGKNKETPRDELRAMGKVEIASKIRGLEKDVAGLESDIDSAKEEHKDHIDDLTAKLEEITKKEKDQRADISKASDKRASKMTEMRDDTEDDHGEIKNINEELSTLRDRQKKVREDLTIRLMDMEMCGCKPSSDLLQKSTVMRQLESENEMPDGYEEILKFEKLEKKKGELMDEQSEEQREYSFESGDLMHRIDLLKQKMNRQDIQADNYVSTDKRTKEMLKIQAKSMGAYLGKKQTQLERMKEDVAKNEKTYNKLEEEMGKCGCGPKGR